MSLLHLPLRGSPPFFCKEEPLDTTSFEDQSFIILSDFTHRLEIRASYTGIRTCFYHNLGRFDGLFLLHFYARQGARVRTLCRNQYIYEIKVYRGRGRLVIRYRDSMALLPLNLRTLGQTLCPHLGEKGIIDHDHISFSYFFLGSA